jgi:hypothetical protein
MKEEKRKRPWRDSPSRCQARELCRCRYSSRALFGHAVIARILLVFRVANAVSSSRREKLLAMRGKRDSLWESAKMLHVRLQQAVFPSDLDYGPVDRRIYNFI